MKELRKFMLRDEGDTIGFRAIILEPSEEGEEDNILAKQEDILNTYKEKLTNNIINTNLTEIIKESMVVDDIKYVVSFIGGTINNFDMTMMFAHSFYQTKTDNCNFKLSNLTKMSKETWKQLLKLEKKYQGE